MSNLIPERITYEELADILDDMSRRIRGGDSFEGNIEYLMPDPDEVPDPKIVEVRGTYRIGNTMGQGGMRMIGQVPGLTPLAHTQGAQRAAGATEPHPGTSPEAPPPQTP